MALKHHRASCHCGKVSIEADLDLRAGTARCNCSICRKARWWGVSVKPEAVTSIQGEDNTFSYRFGSNAIDLRHCKSCGLRVYGRGDIPQMGAFVAINVACLDTASDEDLAAAPIQFCNGRDNDWMHTPAITSYL
jgi:hypothetical protein